MMHPRPPLWQQVVVLSAGVLAISASALLVRATEATALETAFGRTLGSAVLMGALSLGLHRARGAAAPDRSAAPEAGRGVLRAAALAGVFLGLHFWTWMASLDWTSVGSSTTVVVSTPVWLALAAPWIPGEPRLGWRGWVGLAVAMAGVAWLVNDPTGRTTVPGLALALAGAWFAGLYFVVSRQVRASLSTLALGAWTNAAAALTLLVPLLVSGGALLPHSWADAGWMLALVLVPQLVGHNAFLWALRHRSSTFVSTIILLEPAGTLLLAALVLGDWPTAPELVGIGLLLVGIGVVVQRKEEEVVR